jgi:hypothetical protein
MLEATGSSVSSPPHHNMGGENQGIKIPSHIHPSPLHPNVVLQYSHRFRNIEGV